MWKTADGSTGRLIQLCLGYYVFYIVTGVTVKYFLGSADKGLPGFSGIEYLVYSTLGGAGVALSVVIALGWYRMQSIRRIRWGSLEFPSEFLYIIPSGVCTAVVIPTTTLMYTLPISVMVAMVIMRGAIIVVSRIVDAIQIRQGILHKKVYLSENLGVVFAMLAVGAKILWTPAVRASVADALGLEFLRATDTGGRPPFEFLQSKAAMVILGSYIGAYSIRIYLMNYYKNTRAKGMKLDNKSFFGVEQLAASGAMLVFAFLTFNAPKLFGWNVEQVQMFRGAIENPPHLWPWAILAGTAFGIVAFFSVFLFMFKGRTATFAGLVNRLTSLVAGTTATLIFHYVWRGRFPSPEDWISLVFIFIAVGFLASAERKRSAELAASDDDTPAPAPRVAVAPPRVSAG